MENNTTTNDRDRPYVACMQRQLKDLLLYSNGSIRTVVVFVLVVPVAVPVIAIAIAIAIVQEYAKVVTTRTGVEHSFPGELGALMMLLGGGFLWLLLVVQLLLFWVSIHRHRRHHRRDCCKTEQVVGELAAEVVLLADEAERPVRHQSQEMLVVQVPRVLSASE